VRCNTLALLHNFGGRDSRECFNEQMNMVWLNSQLDNMPSRFLTLGFNQGFAILCHIASENRLSAFGCPHQMIDNEVHPMFISLVAVVFHVDKYITIDRLCPLKFG
jgi:hypothetical protein